MATSAKSGDKPGKSKAAAAKPAAKTATAKPAVKPAASDKPKAAKTVAKPAAAKPAKAAKAPATKKSAGPTLSPDQHRGYIEVAAYYIAERRGFQGGNATDDWAQAEIEIERLLREGILKP